MYDIVKNIINYRGSSINNIDTTILNVCSYLVPICFVVVWDLISTFFKKFTNLRK